MSVIQAEVEGSRTVFGAHARISAQSRQPGEARGSRLRAVDGARSLHFGRDDRICCRSYKAPAFMPGGGISSDTDFNVTAHLLTVLGLFLGIPITNEGAESRDRLMLPLSACRWQRGCSLFHR